MRVPLAAVSAAILSVATPASPAAAAEGASAAVVEVKASGTRGQATAERTQSYTAKVKAVDVATRTVTLGWEGGGTGAFKVGPEVKRLDELRAGDTVQLDVVQQLTLEVQVAGSPSVALTVAGGAGGADAAADPGAGAAVGVQGTLTVTAVDNASRRVKLQDSAGSTYEVKAGPGLAVEKLKAGDRLLATFVEAIAVRLEKAPKKP